MKRSRTCSVLLACSVALAALTAPVTALACDTVEQATLKSTCVVMPLEGRQGVWFDVKTADTLRRAKLLVPELQLQVDKYDLVEKKRDAQVHALMEAVALRREAADLLEANIKVHIREAREARQEAARARADAGAWYRSPWMWGVIGAALGGVATAYLASM